MKITENRLSERRTHILAQRLRRKCRRLANESSFYGLNTSFSRLVLFWGLLLFGIAKRVWGPNNKPKIEKTEGAFAFFHILGEYEERPEGPKLWKKAKGPKDRKQAAIFPILFWDRWRGTQDKIGNMVGGGCFPIQSWWWVLGSCGLKSRITQLPRITHHQLWAAF